MGERRGTKALETWCKRVTQGYPGVKVENMTTSWRDGMAFCAMIHHFRPDLIDFSSLDKSDILRNNEMAFRIAERHLGIPALLDAEDMAEYPVPDRLSILTYLSQFYQTFASNSASPVKKPSESPDGSLVSLVQGNVQPNAKMEGAPPWKEPCVVCDHAVFLAQRLRVEGKLYHRTCFRCARCNAQLSTADYYETHNGQFCCETCPDEVMEDSTQLSIQEPPKATDEPQKEEEEPVIKRTRPLPPPEPSPSHKSSLVAMRKMLFDSYDKDTDDAKLIRWDNKPMDVIVNKLETSKNDLSNNDDSSSQIQFINKDSEDIVNKELDDKLKDSPPCVELTHTDSSFNDSINLDKNVNNIIVDSLIKSDVEIDSEKLPPESIENVDTQKHVVEDISHLLDDKEEFNESITLHTDNDLEIKPDIQDTTPNDIVVEAINVAVKIIDMPKDLESKILDNLESETPNNLESETPNNLESEPLKNLESEPIKNLESEPIKNLEPSTPENLQPETPTEKTEETLTVEKVPDKPIIKIKSIDYPEGLNPFGEDEDEKDKSQGSTNPFGSDSEYSEEETSSPSKQKDSLKSGEVVLRKIAPSSNPFGSNEEEEDEEGEEAKRPVPLPRKAAQSSPTPFPRNRLRGSQRSLNSLASSVGSSYTSPRKKKPAPQPPTSPYTTLTSSPYNSLTSSPYNTLTSPRSRKNRRAPLPPSLASSKLSLNTDTSESSDKPVDDKPNDDGSSVCGNTENPKELRGEEIALEISNIVDQISGMVDATNIAMKQDIDVIRKNSINKESLESADNTPKEISGSEAEEIKSNKSTPSTFAMQKKNLPQTPPPKPRRLELPSEEISIASISPTPSASTSNVDSLTYQDSLSSPPTEKKNKDSANMHRKISEERGAVYVMHKSTHGQWRRKKAPAPPLPLTKRRPVRPMPIQNIKQELNDIEIKQQGLERQGVALENKIRDKFDTEASISPYVEEMVLQLFELVNEKNELFRKQAELMYLRKQHHLEEEHAELEYKIRCLMDRPEVNKTDSDKELEEQLIQRLVEVVERRDAIVQCLEMDRLREAEEDKSISTSLGIFTQTMAQDGQSKVIKKHKKKKDKHNTLKTRDLDKDLDESEKEMKKKKKWYTLHHLKNKHL